MVRSWGSGAFSWKRPVAGRILLVEDDQQIAEYIVSGLAEEGFTVDRADNGRDGLFLATDSQFDLVVLDRMLPGMDGLALLKAMRAADVPTPVILLSALGSTDDRISGLTAGADDYLSKPFSFGELLARIHALLRRAAGGVRQAQETTLRCADLELDRLTRQVKRGMRKIALQPLPKIWRLPKAAYAKKPLLQKTSCTIWAPSACSAPTAKPWGGWAK